MVVEMLEALRVQEDDNQGLARRIIHAMRGCRTVPHLAVSGGRIVEVGRICPVCWAESR